MQNNSRFIDLGGGLVSETIATQTMLNYDPTANTAVGFFLGQHFIKPDGNKYMRVGDTPTPDPEQPPAEGGEQDPVDDPV